MKPIVRLLGSKLLTDLTREDLFGYQNQRRKEGIIRGGRESKTKVSDGTIKNELALLRRMVYLARDRGVTGPVRGVGPRQVTEI